MEKVILEGSVLNRQYASGISNYLVNIFKYFKLNEQGFGIESNLILDSLKSSNFFYKNIEQFSKYILPKNKVSFYGDILLGSDKCDLFHSPYMFLPHKSSKRINLLTIHDLINFERPAGIRHEVRRRILLSSINRADNYICISNATKDKLLSHFPNINENKIKVIYQGIESFFFEDNSSKEEMTLNKPYVLYVGQRSEYKNFIALLEFFRKSKWKKEVDLICVGGGPFIDYELRKIEDYKLTNHVFHIGYVDNNKLKNLYSKAFCLMYPSLHEGFGIPIIEAMSTRCPVICGNFSSMKEISGSHSTLVEDFSIESLEDALNRVSTIDLDSILSAQDYSLKFTWESTANNTLSYYSDLLGTNLNKQI